MNLKSNLFLKAINKLSGYLAQAGYTLKYSQQQNRYNASRKESSSTSGMQVQVFESDNGDQIALTFSDDRQVNLSINAGFSLSNQVFISIVEIKLQDNKESKDYSNQVIDIINKISFESFSESIKQAIELMSELIQDLGQKELNVQALLNNALSYRNTFSSTSQVTGLIYHGQKTKTASKALYTVLNCLFNSPMMFDRGLLSKVSGKAIQGQAIKQLRYTEKVIKHLLDTVFAG